MPVKSAAKLRALFIVHLPPPVYGATIANNYLINSNLINEMFDTHFINLATNSKLLELRKPTIKKAFLFISIFAKVFRAVITNKYDICFVSITASGPAFYKDLIIVAVLKLFRSNILYFFHNKGVAHASLNKINHYLYKFAFHNTKSVILSKHLYTDIEKYVREKDVFYCPYGIPVTNYTGPDKKLKADSSICRLLFLGNMMVEKGVLVLLEACRLLKENNCIFNCHFVGGWTDISSEEFNEYVVKYDLSDRVSVHGPKYNAEKLWFFNNSDIFIFPTYYHYETFGLVNLEAMQYGLPIVSTPEGGIPDIVIDGENGFLVPQHDVKALANKIETLIRNPDLRIKMGSAGQVRFYKLFTLNNFEENIVRIMSETAKIKMQKELST